MYMCIENRTDNLAQLMKLSLDQHGLE